MMVMAFVLKYTVIMKFIYFSAVDISEKSLEFHWDDHGLTYWTNYIICYIDRFINHPCFPRISPIWSLGGDSFAIELVFPIFILRLIYFASEIVIFYKWMNEYIHKWMNKWKISEINENIKNFIVNIFHYK